MLYGVTTACCVPWQIWKNTAGKSASCTCPSQDPELPISYSPSHFNEWNTLKTILQGWWSLFLGVEWEMILDKWQAIYISMSIFDRTIIDSWWLMVDMIWRRDLLDVPEQLDEGAAEGPLAHLTGNLKKNCCQILPEKLCLLVHCQGTYHAMHYALSLDRSLKKYYSRAQLPVFS